MKIKSWSLLLILTVLVSISPASAVYFINGTTYRSDTGGVLGGVYVFNGTNYTTSDATTGVFSISSMQNNTNGWIFTAQYNTTGSYAPNTTVIVVNGADVSGVNMNLTVRVPAISSLASSGVGKKSATVSWTANFSNVGNRLTYSTDSALSNNVFTTDWSNSTATPSFALSNLRVYTKYYYSASTANMVNSSSTYTTTSSTGTFTTTHGYAEEELPIEAIAKAVVTNPKPTAKPLIDLGAITGSKGGSNKGVGLLIVIIIIGGIVAYAWQPGKGKSKPPTKRKNK